MPLHALASLVAPPLCWGCRAPAPRQEPLCGRCRAELRWLPARSLLAGGVRAWAPLAYEGAARELVRALKYSGARALADTMAAQMAANAPAELLDREAERLTAAAPAARSPPALVPVPLSAARLRRRGFNQAELLAARLAERTGLAVVDCLERSGRAQAQVGRGRAQRLAPGAGVRSRAPVPADAILVDDVITTGATLAASAAALRAGGARKVRAIAYARTLAR